MIGTLKFVDSVSISSDAPPSSSAAFRRLSPWPGIVTQRSRGNDTTKPVCDAGSTWTTIIVSERCPLTSSAVPNASFSWSVCTNARVSVPMIRKFAGSPFSCGTSRSSRMCVVGIWSTASSKNRLPVETPIAVATSTRTSAIAKRPTKCLNEEPGATTGAIVPAASRRREPQLSGRSHVLDRRAIRPGGRGRGR